MQIGDDLIKAREFVEAAEVGVSRLQAGDIAAPDILAIRDAAADLQARGIARSAEGVLRAHTQSESPEHIQGNVYSLTRLIDQYKAGLDEIAPVQIEARENKTKIDLLSAQETLEPLIKYAPAPAQQSALQYLSNYQPDNREESPRLDRGGVHLETIMPSVTDHILSGARQSGKAVSISYAVGDIVVPEALAMEVLSFLEELGADLVADTLAFPEVRKARGLPASGLINVTAKLEHAKLSLQIECSGYAQKSTPADLKSLSALTSRGGMFSIHKSGENTRVNLNNVALLSDGEAPLINSLNLVQEAVL